MVSSSASNKEFQLSMRNLYPAAVLPRLVSLEIIYSGLGSFAFWLVTNLLLRSKVPRQFLGWRKRCSYWALGLTGFTGIAMFRHTPVAACAEMLGKWPGPLRA